MVNVSMNAVTYEKASTATTVAAKPRLRCRDAYEDGGEDVVEVEVGVCDEVQCEGHVVEAMRFEGVGGVQYRVEVVRPQVVGDEGQYEYVAVGLRRVAAGQRQV